MKKIHFFLYYILLGISMLLLGFIDQGHIYKRLLIFLFLLFFTLGAIDHYKDLIGLKKHKLGIENLKKLIGTFLAAAVTWYINHEMGFGPIVANGLVGIVVALLFSPKLAGAFYAASFVGMSSKVIIPTVCIAGVAGFLSGIVILFSREVYSGIGGKGGTTAAISTQIVSRILKLFV